MSLVPKMPDDGHKPPLPSDASHYGAWIKEAILTSSATLALVPSTMATPLLSRHTSSQEALAACIWSSYAIDDDMRQIVSGTEQRVPFWHTMRNGWLSPENGIFRGKLVSSSIAGDLLKHKKVYTKSETPVLQRDGSPSLHTMYVNTQRGTASEPPIRQEFQVVCQSFYGPDAILSIDEVGLQISKQHPWTAASPDGIVRVMDTKKLALGQSPYHQSGLEMKCRGGERMLPYVMVPHDYFDQMCHTMQILGLQDYWFACHSTTMLQVDYYRYNAEYWNPQLKKLEVWYWRNYWPTIVMLYTGALEPLRRIVVESFSTKAAVAGGVSCKSTTLSPDTNCTAENQAASKKRAQPCGGVEGGHPSWHTSNNQKSCEALSEALSESVIDSVMTLPVASTSLEPDVLMKWCVTNDICALLSAAAQLCNAGILLSE